MRVNPYKQNMKISLISCFTFVFILSCFSAKKDTIVYQYTLYGLGTSQQKISFLSPIYYDGISLIGTNGNIKSSLNKINSSSFDFNIDINSNKYNKEIYSFGVDYIYNKHYLLSFDRYPSNYPNLYLGWGYWFETDAYLKPENTNNPLYYNFNNMLCLSIGVEKHYKSIYILNEFNLSLVGLYSGSEYSSSLPYFFSEENASFFEAFQIGSFERNSQMKNRLNIDYRISTKRKVYTIRFQYVISACMLNINNNIKHNTFHEFKVGYLFNNSYYVHK